MKKWMILASVGMMLTGCSADVTEHNLSHLHFVKYEEMEGDKSPEERAAAIKLQLNRIDGISGNAVVVEGHTAIIGLRTEENMEQNAISRVKKEADRAAKEADVSIERTSITVNSYIVGMIEEMERERAG